MDRHFLAKIRKQGSGLHIYFTTEMIEQPDFPLKEKDAILIVLGKKEIMIKKIDWAKVV